MPLTTDGRASFAPSSTPSDVDPDVDALVQGWIDVYHGDRVDVAHLLCDRHRGVALDYVDASGAEASYTFEELRELSARCASALAHRGVREGDRVATLLPKSPELVVTALAIWRLGAVHLPLFTAFGPDAIAYRLGDAGAALVVTDAVQRAKLAGLAATLLVAGDEAGPHDFWGAVRAAEPLGTCAVRRGDDVMIVLYTSGTTGQPKGALVPVKALAAFEAYMRFGLDLREDDVFWNIADPGWAYGLYFALVGPLLLGHRTLFYNAPFDAAATWRLLRERGVTNFAAAPTVYRALRAYAAAHPAAAGPLERPRLRVASSAGEPLNPEVIRWAEEALGAAIHDQYGQTEVGMVVNNHHHPALARPLRPGAMGHAMPGFRVAIVDADGEEVAPGVEGDVAVDMARSPLDWFRGFLHAPEIKRERTRRGRYNVTGDVARRDADGYVFFSGRRDDVITSAGYRIGPFEIESALVQHPAVAEAAAVGKPDAIKGQAVCAFVVLRPGQAASDALAAELSGFVKTRLSAHAFPREIRFVGALPKTPSGKVQRYLLRAELMAG